MARQADDDEDGEEEQRDLVLFQGTTSGFQPDLSKQSKLVSAGLMRAKAFVTDGIERRAGMLVLEPKGDKSAVRMIVDGIAYPGGALPKPHAFAVTQMIKLLAGLDIEERQRPQQGGIKASFDEIPYELTVESQPVAGKAERLVLRIRNTKIELETPQQVGIPASLEQRVRELTTDRQGLVLCCGPPHSGLTTLVRAVVQCVDRYLYGTYSIARGDKRDIRGVTVFKTNEGDDLETSLMRLVRAEADVIYVDPPTSSESFRVLLEMQDRLSMIAEFSSRDTAHGLAQLVQWSGDPAAVAGAVRLLVSQKLLRSLCPQCREAFRPNPKLLSRIGLPEDTKVLYRAYRPPEPAEDDEEEPEEVEPCDKCGGIGYFGQVAMFEVLEMTDAVKQAVLAGGQAAQIREAARQDKERNVGLQRDGIRLVGEGKTSLEELQRVFQPK